MALESGSRVGIYEVTGKLGEGGMGQVYRAHDSSLDRDVALKVLPETFLADPDRLARFQREAKVLASFNTSRHSLNARSRDEYWGKVCSRKSILSLTGMPA